MKKGEKKDMPKKESAAVTSAKENVKGMVIVAIIGLLGIVATAILNPLGQKWVNKPEPTPNPKSLAIEEIPLTVYTFAGDDDPTCCAGQAHLELTYDIDHLPWYALNYTVPAIQSKHGYAGFAFVFSESQNLSEYNAIEFTIKFGDGINEADINFEDITKTTLPFHIVGNGQQEINVVVPVNNFRGINLSAVRSIGFQVDSKYTSGNHKFVIKNIQLTKN